MNTKLVVETPERVLQRLEWQVIRRLDGLLQGDYRSLFYGQGVDFADLREYQPQDDIRHIDWNVTARMDTPYVRQYIEDREITAWFLLDLSPSMAFGNLERQKSDVLIELVTTLARLLTRNGNRVGALFFNQKVDLTIPPRSSRLQVLRLAHELQRRPAPDRGALTDLRPLLQAAHNTVRRRSLIFLISDFLCAPGWERPLHLLSRRHDLLTIRLWDPREENLPDAGLLWVEDAESGAQLYVDTSNLAFRRRFYEAARRRQVTLNDRFKRAGVDHAAIATDEDLVSAVVHLASLRKKRKR